MVTLLQVGAHSNTSVSVGPIGLQNFKLIRALESAYNHHQHLPWKTINIMLSGAHAYNDNFHIRVNSFIGQHIGKDLACCPQQELSTMHSEGSQQSP